VTGAPPPLLIFQVGPSRFAADAADVERIDPARAGPRGLAEASCLGAPSAARCELVVRGAASALAVDLVLGIREPAPDDLRALPELAAACLASSAVRGLVLLDGTPTPVIDLPTLVCELRPAGSAPEPGEPHHA